MGREPSVRERRIPAWCQEGSGGDEAENGEEYAVEAKGWREGVIAFMLSGLHAIWSLERIGVGMIPKRF